eukprot:9382868-Pyramimonas_sp.AAC.4
MQSPADLLPFQDVSSPFHHEDSTTRKRLDREIKRKVRSGRFPNSPRVKERALVAPPYSGACPVPEKVNPIPLHYGSRYGLGLSFPLSFRLRENATSILRSIKEYLSVKYIGFNRERVPTPYRNITGTHSAKS